MCAECWESFFLSWATLYKLVRVKHLGKGVHSAVSPPRSLLCGPPLLLRFCYCPPRVDLSSQDTDYALAHPDLSITCCVEYGVSTRRRSLCCLPSACFFSYLSFFFFFLIPRMEPRPVFHCYTSPVLICFVLLWFGLVLVCLFL